MWLTHECDSRSEKGGGAGSAVKIDDKDGCDGVNGNDGSEDNKH